MPVVADKTVSGGGNRAYFFRIVDTGSAYQFKKLDGSTAAASSDDASLLLQLIAETKPGIASPIANPEFDQDGDNPALKAFLDAVAFTPAATAGGAKIAQRTYEDSSTKFGDVAADAPLVGVISLGGLLEGDATKRKVFASIGYMSSDSGNFTQNATSSSKPIVKMVGAKAKYELDFSDLLDADEFAAAQELIIPEGLGFNYEFLTVA